MIINFDSYPSQANLYLWSKVQFRKYENMNNFKEKWGKNKQFDILVYQNLNLEKGGWFYFIKLYKYNLLAANKKYDIGKLLQ